MPESRRNAGGHLGKGRHVRDAGDGIGLSHDDPADVPDAHRSDDDLGETDPAWRHRVAERTGEQDDQPDDDDAQHDDAERNDAGQPTRSAPTGEVEVVITSTTYNSAEPQLQAAIDELAADSTHGGQQSTDPRVPFDGKRISAVTPAVQDAAVAAAAAAVIEPLQGSMRNDAAVALPPRPHVPDDDQPQPTLKERIQAVVRRVQAWRAVRAFQRFSDERANLLAGGITYISLLSVGSALIVGFTLLNAVLQNYPAMLNQVVNTTAQQLPGLLTYGGQQGLVEPSDLFKKNPWTLGSLIALVLALWSGTGWLNALREGIRAIFRVPPDDTFMLKRKAKDIAVMGSLGLVVVLSTAGSFIINAGATVVLRNIGLGDGAVGQFVIRALGVAVVLAIDTLFLIILIRVLTGLSLAWRVVSQGAFVGAIGLGLLKLFGGLLLGSAGGNNPVLAGSAVLVGLMAWLNLAARITLYAAAWTAESARDYRVNEVLATLTPTVAAPHPPDHAEPIGPMPPSAPALRRRQRDSMVLAAGVAIGAAVLGSVRVLRRVQGRKEVDHH